MKTLIKFTCLLSLLGTVNSEAANYAHEAEGTIVPDNTAPGAPGTWNTGSMTLIYTTARTGAQTIATPSGWTDVVHSDVDGIALFCRIKQGGDTLPTIDWTGSPAVRTQAVSFSGGFGSCASVVDASSLRALASSSTFPYNSLTVANDNELVLILGKKQKTATSDGTTTNNVTNFTEIGEDNGAGTNLNFIWNYWVQTTKANISSGNWGQTGTTETGSVASIVVAFKPAASVPIFTSAPTIDQRTTSSIRVAYTVDTTGTVYAARLTDGSSAPTCDQLEAQTATGAVQYASDSATATVADNFTFGSITDGTKTDIYVCLEDGSSNDSAVASSGNLADAFKIPAFSSGPTFQSCTSVGCTYSFTLDGPGNVFGVACKSGVTAATPTQIEAAHCTGDVAAVAAANKSVTGADTLVIGTALDYPIHDFGIAGTYGGQHEASGHADAVRLKSAPTGTIYDTITSTCSSTAWCNNISSPSVAAGDVEELDSPTAIGGHTVSVDGTGDWNFFNSGDRDRICVRVYDKSAQDWMSITSPSSYCTGTRAAAWFNNHAPEPNQPDENIFLQKDEVFSFDLCASFGDQDGDTLTGSNSSTGTGTGTDKHPAGTSFTDCIFADTGAGPTAAGTGSFVFTATDIAGATGTKTYNWEVVDQVTVPDCETDNLDFGTCSGLMDAALLNAQISATQCSTTIAAGSVISQNPSAGAQVEPFSEVGLVVAKICVKSGRGVHGVGLGVH